MLTGSLSWGAVSQILGAAVQGPGATPPAGVCPPGNFQLIDAETLIYDAGHVGVSSLTIDPISGQWFATLRLAAGNAERIDRGTLTPLATTATTGSLGATVGSPTLVISNPSLATEFLVYTNQGFTLCAGAAFTVGCPGIRAFSPVFGLLNQNDRTTTIQAIPPDGVARDDLAVYSFRNVGGGATGQLWLDRYNQTTLTTIEALAPIQYGTGSHAGVSVDTGTNKVYTGHSTTGSLLQWTANPPAYDLEVGTSHANLITSTVINPVAGALYAGSGFSGVRVTRHTLPGLAETASVTYVGEGIGTNTLVFDRINNKLYSFQANGANGIVRRINPSTLVTEDSLTLVGFPVNTGPRNAAQIDLTGQNLYITRTGAADTSALKRIDLCS